MAGEPRRRFVTPRIRPVMNDAPSIPETVATLRRVIADLSNGQLAADDIDPGGHMLDNGYLDSLSAVLLLARMDEMWAVDIEDTCLLNGATTVNDLAALVHTRCF